MLPLLRVPTLVLHRNERFVRIAAGQAMAAMIPGARFVELAGNDHLWWVGDCDGLMREVEQFFAQLRRPQPAITPRVLRVVLCVAVPRTLRERDGQIAVENGGRIAHAEGAESHLITTFFEAPTAALISALALQRLDPCEVSASVHLGEVDLNDAGSADVEPVATARTRLAAARGGDVLASTSLCLLAPAEFEFEALPDCGGRRLAKRH